MSRKSKLAAVLAISLGLVVAEILVVPSRDQPRPDILLITVDTLRADRLSSYDHSRQTTPFIDGLAERGLRFERAYSTTSWTAPAMVSMLSSTYPSQHGVVTGLVNEEAEVYSQPIMPDDLLSLPGLLQAGGYRSFGLTANGHLSAELGFSRGFDQFRCVGFEWLDHVEAVLADWRDDLNDGPAWFLWLHILDPHAPYMPREPWLTSFWPRTRERYPDLEDEGQLENLKTPDRMAYVQALYDSEIRNVDDFLRRFFLSVPRASDAVVLFTSDHGEEFHEHRGTQHGRTLYEEVLRIPFVLKLPGDRFAGTVVEEPVSLLDVLPTLLELAGLDPPADAAGHSLIGLASGRKMAPRSIFASLSRRGKVESITLGRWKLIEDKVDELFDLEADPGEQVNLIAGEVARAEMLSRLLAAHAKSQPRTPERKVIGPEELEQLRSLGYVE